MNQSAPQLQEDMIIEQAYQNLLNGYLSSNHRKKVEVIDKAYRFARAAHKGIRRRSGEPYILHPITVATIVSQEIGLGSTSICAALLHDVVEDTDYTVEDIEAQFGHKVAVIVEGLTKISGGIFAANTSAQAENFRKLLLTMSDDIRVILIKIADRLHNMRTLESMPTAKQYKIAGETLYIYAPLAHRLGLFAIKTELEDLSFKYEHPEVYRQIDADIAANMPHNTEMFDRFAAPIRKELDAQGLKYEFRSRIKSHYSIWKKMEAKHIPFSEVYDYYAARIVFECDNEADEKRLCWSIYSDITDIYHLHPDRVRDWVSTPKANGYRALHITVMGPDGEWVEVQIRSKRMDDIAERGFAAHWKYKIGEGEEESELAAWLQTIEDILKNPEPNAIDFLDTIKLNLFASEIVVFTPKGDLVTLPKGASVLDMAFTLHTNVGSECIAGKVNHKLVPLSHKLESGDQVEVLTSRSQQPQASWENFLVTATGKTRLRSALRAARRDVINTGQERLNAFLDEHELKLDNSTLSRLVSEAGAANKDDLFMKIGNGGLALNADLAKRVKHGAGATGGSSSGSKLWGRLLHPFKGSASNGGASKPQATIDKKKVYVLRSQADGTANYTVNDCCNPIPGDDVLGFVDQQGRVVVHKQDCPVAARLKASDGPSIVSTKWEQQDAGQFVASIAIDGIDRMGVLQELVYLISTNMAINMRRLNIDSNGGLFHAELDVQVQDTRNVDNLCKRLKKVDGVKSAARIK